MQSGLTVAASTYVRSLVTLIQKSGNSYGWVSSRDMHCVSYPARAVSSRRSDQKREQISWPLHLFVYHDRHKITSCLTVPVPPSVSAASTGTSGRVALGRTAAASGVIRLVQDLHHRLNIITETGFICNACRRLIEFIMHNIHQPVKRHA